MVCGRTHSGLVNVYFYIVKYRLAEGWSEPGGMSCGANLELLYILPNEFECIVRKEGRGEWQEGEKEDGRNRESGQNVVKTLV